MTTLWNRPNAALHGVLIECTGYAERENVKPSGGRSVLERARPATAPRLSPGERRIPTA
jgi:hypothetical protein